MNVLGFVTLDFISQLKQEVSGWQIQPLVVPLDSHASHGNKMAYRPAPQNVSPITYFEQSQPLGNLTHVLIKIPKHHLRLLRLALDRGPNPL